MKTKVKKIWTDALRSGKYQQNLMSLRGGEGTYCVLGVLTKEYLDYHHISEDDFEWEIGEYLSAGVLAWAGLDLENDSIFIDELHESLSTMNDQGKSFEELADIIDKHL